MIANLYQLLTRSGEALTFDMVRTGEDTLRVVLTLKLPKLDAGTHAHQEPYKTLLEAHEKARALLTKPLLFEGTAQEVEAQIAQFVQSEQSEQITQAASEVSNLADEVKQMIEQAKANAEKKQKSTKSKGKTAEKKDKAETKKATKPKADEKPATPPEPPAPEMDDLFAF